MSDDNFVPGFFVKEPHGNAPDYVKAKVSIKRKDLGNYLRSVEDDWINIDIMVSKGGKWYAKIDDWKPDPSKKSSDQPVSREPGEDDDEPPF